MTDDEKKMLKALEDICEIYMMFDNPVRDMYHVANTCVQEVKSCQDPKDQRIKPKPKSPLSLVKK